MTSAILSIGDELLIGQVINTNQAYIAEKLNSVGVTVERMITVGDKQEEILRSFVETFSHFDIVTVTGGLGPTHDDVTRSAVCAFFKTDLIVNEEALEHIRRLSEKRGIALIKMNEDQALVPRSCTVVQNARGTAPGYFFDRDGKFFVVMPGVPFEMKGMMEEFVVPFLAKRGTGAVIRHRTLKTTGIPESLLAHHIGDVDRLFDRDANITLAYLPSPMGVRLRISAKGETGGEVETRIKEVETRLREKAGKYIYGIDEEELEHVVGKMLTERKLTLAVAESCTGGLITDRMTDVPGSSQYFERGAVSYSNDSKHTDLGVPLSLLRQHGAVSKEVAEAMAFGIRVTANVDIGISTTGIAGPTGGSPDKPVGLVWIGYSDRNQTIALRFSLGEDRRRIKERAAQAALELVRRKLLKLV